MFWVACNICFVRPKDACKRKYFITNCCHIICERCITPGISTCPRCSSTCRMIICDSDMPEEIKEIFFFDANEKLSNFTKALDYQAGQRMGLMTYQRTVAQKYLSAKLYIKECDNKLNILNQKYDAARLKIKDLECLIETLKRKLAFYTSKQASLNGSSTSAPKPSFSQLSFQTPSSYGFKSALSQSRHSPSESHFSISSQRTPMAFTPKNSYGNYRTKMSSQFTPDSSGSVKSSLLSSLGSNYSYRAKSGAGCTPPSKTLELLSLLNKSRKHY